MNKIVNICLLIFLILFISCTRVEKEYYPNGQLMNEYEVKNEMKNGYFKSYYENGNIKIIANYKSDTLNGIKKEFYENQILKSNAEYLNGMIKGEFSEFYENCKIKTNGYVLNDTLVYKAEYDKNEYLIDDIGEIRIIKEKDTISINEQYNIHLQIFLPLFRKHKLRIAVMENNRKPEVKDFKEIKLTNRYVNFKHKFTKSGVYCLHIRYEWHEKEYVYVESKYPKVFVK